MDDLISKSFQQSIKIINDFINNEHNLKSINSAADLMVNTIKKGGKIISFGNGGSMSDAMHFAEEMTGRFREDRNPLAAVSISDPAHITCTANDYGFDSIFSRYIEAHGKAGDIALAISTSGNSENILKACRIAKEKGMSIVGLTGKTGGKLAGLADVEIRVSHNEYSDRIQEVHIIIIHILIEMIENAVK